MTQHPPVRIEKGTRVLFAPGIEGVVVKIFGNDPVAPTDFDFLVRMDKGNEILVPKSKILAVIED